MRKTIQHLPKSSKVILRLIAELLLATRKAKKMRQSDLATRVDVSRQTIARMEKGDPHVAIGIYLTTAWILDVPIFLGFDSDVTKAEEGLAQILSFLQKQLPQRISKKNEKEIDDNF